MPRTRATSDDETTGPPERSLRILFITPRLPDPRGRGYQLRASHQLRILGRRHRITLLSFVEEPVPAEARQVSAACERVVTVPLRRLAMLAGLARRIPSSVPLQVGLHESRAMRRAVREAVGRERYDLVHVQLVRMAPYLADASGPARVVDLVDALSLNMRRRSEQDRGLARWLARLEARRLAAYERRICGSVEGAVVCSPFDREVIGTFPHLTTVTNGVDLAEFRYSRTSRDAHRIVFAGNMGYFPNVHAVTWFVRAVLPLIRRVRPSVRLDVVGARPHPAVLRLQREVAGVTVAGFVDHMPPHLTRAALAVAPMRAGSGQQLKVLEAMACGTPVVATTLATTGLEVVREAHVLVGDTAEAFAAQCVRLLEDGALGDRLAGEGRRLVETRYTWERSVRQLEAVYQAVTAGPRGQAEPVEESGRRGDAAGPGL